MLVEILIQNTLEMQGFRVAEVTFANGILEVEIVPDRRCSPCCGVCGQRAAMTGRHGLMAKLLYGGGLRLMECIRLRIQDMDFGQGLIFVRGGKGGQGPDHHSTQKSAERFAGAG